MGERRVGLVGLALAACAAVAGVAHLRSYEFVPWGGAIFAPLAPVAPPKGGQSERDFHSEAPSAPKAAQSEQVVHSEAPSAPKAAQSERVVHSEGGSAPLAGSVTIVIIDGLRLDVSRALPNLNALRARGTEAVVRADFPSFSRVGYAGILTGAHPRVHGYLSNWNRRPSPVESIADVARGAGIPTRFYTEHWPRSWIPAMFPEAFDVFAPLDERAVAALAAGPRPCLNLIYIREPDVAGHTYGGASEEYRRAAAAVDATVGRIAAALGFLAPPDHPERSAGGLLGSPDHPERSAGERQRAGAESKDALLVATDHGHRDRGGHGGHEAAVTEVPLIGAGPGADVSAARSLRDIAPLAARALGIRAPDGAGVVPAGDAPHGPLSRLALAAAALAALAALARPRQGARDLAAGVAGMGTFAFLYALRGHPFSFSCVNADRDVPFFVLETLCLAGAGVLAGAFLSRSGARYAAAAMILAVAVALGTGAWAGPTAATGLDHPQAGYLYTLALEYAVAAGLLAAPIVRAAARPARAVPAAPVER